MTKPSDDDPASGPPAGPKPETAPPDPQATVLFEAEVTPTKGRYVQPPPRPADAEFPGPPPSLEMPEALAPVKGPEQPESKFPEIDAAIRIVDVDTRPLDRRSTALNPWNVQTPGMGVEAAAVLEALKDMRRPTGVVEPSGERRWFRLLAIAIGAAVLTFATVIIVALVNGHYAADEVQPAAAPAIVKLPEIPVTPVQLDPATLAGKRQEMVAAFDRHDFSQGISIGTELEVAGALDAEAEFWLADACRHAGRVAEALKRYEEFIKAHPDHKLVDAAHFEAGEVARRDGKTDVARQHYKAVIADEKSGLRNKAKKRLAALR